MRRILIFRGGGYDGCIWEWNALLFDQGKLAGKQLVSGRSGQHALATVQELGVYRGVLALIRGGYNSRKEETTPFLIRTDAQWETFCKEWNSGFVRTVAKAAGRPCRCDRCGKFFDWEEIFHTGYRGDGGVGIQYEDNKCSDCAAVEHDEYIAEEWRTLRLSTRVEAIQRARREGYDVSVFAARRDEMPAIPADCVWENQLY